MMMMSSPNDDDVIAKDDQDDEESTPPTRPSTSEVEDTLGTLQGLSMFSKSGDEILSFVLNMESLLVYEWTDNLKHSVATDFFKRR